MREQVEIGPISRSLLADTEGAIDVTHVRRRHTQFRESLGLPLFNLSDQQLIDIEQGRRRVIREFLDSSLVLKSL